MRKILAAAAITAAVVLPAGAASAASGHVGASTGSGVGRVEMDWTTSGCPAGQYKAEVMTYWNALPSGSSNVGFQTMLNNGAKLSRWDLTPGQTLYRVPPAVCGTATTKTEVTRLSDGAKWCIILTQGNGAAMNAGRCSGF